MPNKFLPPQTTTAIRSAATPLDGEVFYDTDEKKLYQGDGTTVGGIAVGAGASSYSALTDVDTTGLATGQTMVWNGTFWVPGSSGREVLTANRTYYVRTDGSDSNDGLANTAGGAFLTIQKAIDVAATLDASIYDVTIAFSGAYTVTSSIIIKRPLGSGKLIIDGGNNATSSISSALSNTLNRGLIICYGHQNIFLRNFKTNVLYPGLWGMHIHVGRGGDVICSNLDFGDLPSVSVFTSHVISDSNAVVTFDSAYKISGGISGTADQGRHLFARNGGFISTGQYAVTITNTPKFITFSEVESTGIVVSYLTTFSGDVLTGCKKYNATLNAIVNQFGLGASYPFPGNVAGTTSTGGQYA